MMRLFVVVLAAFGAALFEWAAVPFLPEAFRPHPAIPALVILTVASRGRAAYTFALTYGIVIDTLALARTEVATVRMVFLALLMQLVLRHLLTNRSLYAVVALAVMARMVDWVMTRILVALIELFSGSTFGAMGDVYGGRTLLWDALIVGGLFLFLALFTPRFARARSSSGYVEA